MCVRTGKLHSELFEAHTSMECILKTDASYKSWVFDMARRWDTEQLLQRFFFSIWFSRNTTNLIPRSRAPGEKLIYAQLVKKFPFFYGTRKFIIELRAACHWSLSWARGILSIPSEHISLRSIPILHSRLRLGLTNDFLTKIVYAFLISPLRVMFPGHLIFLNLITVVIMKYKWKLFITSYHFLIVDYFC
jgi:hypothetical protein